MSGRHATKPTSDAPDTSAMRTCLKCRDDFWSEHKGNRICEPCKRGESWRSPVGNFALGGGLIGHTRRGTRIQGAGGDNR